MKMPTFPYNYNIAAKKKLVVDSAADLELFHLILANGEEQQILRKDKVLGLWRNIRQITESMYCS